MAGPGAYDVNTNAIKAKNPGAAFSKAGRGGQTTRDNRDMGPGPGNYNHPSKFGGPSFSMKGKKPNDRVNPNPGPG